MTGVEAAHMNRSTCLAVVGALLSSLGGTRLSVCVSSYGGRAVCGWCPLKAETGVQFPLGAPVISSTYLLSRAARPALLQLFSNTQWRLSLLRLRSPVGDLHASCRDEALESALV